MNGYSEEVACFAVLTQHLPQFTIIVIYQACVKYSMGPLGAFSLSELSLSLIFDIGILVFVFYF